MMQCALGSEAVAKLAYLDGQSQPRKLCLMIPPHLGLLILWPVVVFKLMRDKLMCSLNDDAGVSCLGQ